MKKFTCVLLILGLIVGIFSLPAFAAEDETTIKVFAENTVRGENQLILYNAHFGTHTNTNIYGAEAVVDENGLVLRVTTSGNEEIPANGFVISGHGTAKEWILKNIRKGMYAAYREYSGTVAVSTSDEVAKELCYTVSYRFDALNAPRMENQMILYTVFGGETDTNEWGIEAVVNNGRIVSVGGNDHIVPQNGFVISAHGEASLWLKENAQVGMHVKYDDRRQELYLTKDVQAYGITMQNTIDELKTDRANAQARYRLIQEDGFLSALSLAEQTRERFLSENSVSKRFDDFRSFQQSVFQAQMCLTESRPAETRGCWLRPKETTKEAVKETVTALKNAGINTISLETNFNGTLICPAPENALWEQNPLFNGFDVLQAYIEECHFQKMALHLWMPVFNWGNLDSPLIELSPWFKKPSWRAISNLGLDHVTLSDDTVCFLNPADPEVRTFLLDVYRYLLTMYDVDGFELDYIRYRQRDAEDFGYDPLTVAGWQEKTWQTVTPVYDPESEYWESLADYRCSIITEFVGSVRTLIDETAPAVLLSADVMTDSQNAADLVYQDYPTWMANGWLDILKPMSYSTEDIACLSEVMKSAEHCSVYAGLGVFNDAYTIKDIAFHALDAQKFGVDGYLFFDGDSLLSKDAASVFSGGLFRSTAIAPTFDVKESVKAALGYMRDRIQKVILPGGGLTEKQARNLLKDLNELMKKADEWPSSKISEKIGKIRVETEDDEAKAAVENDLAYVLRLLSYDKNEQKSNNILFVSLLCAAFVLILLLSLAFIFNRKRKNA